MKLTPQDLILLVVIVTLILVLGVVVYAMTASSPHVAPC